MACTPSARLELEFDDNSGTAADEGTAAHALAEHKLRKALKLRSKKPVSKYDCDEMDVHTDDYVAFVMERIAQAKQTCADPMILIEQKLDFSKYVEDGFGTGDFVLIADGTIHIVDFKYGQGVLVEAEDNPQMKLYALGAWNCSTESTTPARFHDHLPAPARERQHPHGIQGIPVPLGGGILKPTAALAYDGGGEYIPGAHCQFCRAAVKCRRGLKPR
jgi:hypothetical protein